MNILQQYQKAIHERGGGGLVEISTHTELKIGGTFVFGGYSWQRVGERVALCCGRGDQPYGFAEIIKIDAGGFKTARRTK